MNNLDAMAEEIRKELTAKDEAREKMLPLCRDSIRYSSTAIRAIHRQEFNEAARQIKSARSVLSVAERAVKEYKEIANTGAVRDAQKELAEALTGIREVANGKIVFDSTDTTNLSPREIIDQGIGYIPEDRVNEGAILDFTLAENLVFRNIPNHPTLLSRLMDYDRLNDFALKLFLLLWVLFLL